MTTLFYQDPKAFLIGWDQFWPLDSRLSPVQRINAAARLTIYTTIAMYFVRRDTRFLAAGIILLVALGIYAHANDVGSPAVKPVIGYDPRSPLQQDLVNKTVVMKSNVKDRSKAEQWMDKERQKTQCKKSSLTNPFANHLVSDPMSMDTACPYDSQKDEVEKHFRHNLMQDSDDIYEKQNSQRQFYSMPVGAIPDTKAFALFLAGGKIEPTCKEASKYCKVNTGY